MDASHSEAKKRKYSSDQDIYDLANEYFRTNSIPAVRDGISSKCEPGSFTDLREATKITDAKCEKTTTEQPACTGKVEGHKVKALDSQAETIESDFPLEDEKTLEESISEPKQTEQKESVKREYIQSEQNVSTTENNQYQELNQSNTHNIFECLHNSLNGLNNDYLQCRNELSQLKASQIESTIIMTGLKKGKDTLEGQLSDLTQSLKQKKASLKMAKQEFKERSEKYHAMEKELKEKSSELDGLIHEFASLMEKRDNILKTEMSPQNGINDHVDDGLVCSSKQDTAPPHYDISNDDHDKPVAQNEDVYTLTKKKQGEENKSGVVKCCDCM